MISNNMLTRSRALLGLSFAACLCTVIWPSPARAQLTPIEVEGELLSANSNALTIRTEGANDILIGLIDPRRIDDGVQYEGVPDPEVTVQGSEKPSYLAPGMFVRFQARLQGTKRVVEPVDEVTLITPDENTVFGVTPLDAPDLDRGDDPPPRAAGGRANEAEALVVGQLRAARRTSLVVAFPNGESLQVPLSRQAVVELEASDARYVRPGDRVKAQGFALKPPKFFATKVTITRVEDVNRAAVRARAATARAAAAADAAHPDRRPIPQGNPENPFDLGDPMDQAKPAEPPQAPPRRKMIKIN